jgi:transposase
VVEQELRGRGVTLRLLWLEYLSRHPEGWRYTQFCEQFHAWQQRSRPPRMRQPHRAGAALEVDWAGKKLPVVDTGVAREAQVFVACLPCSDLIYAEATWTQGQEDWLAAHVRAFAYIGGCPEMLVPDNTKTGVSEANYWDPVLNRSYQALARHYEVAIVPARVRRPRDKATAENAVRLVEMWVLAPLRSGEQAALDLLLAQPLRYRPAQSCPRGTVEIFFYCRPRDPGAPRYSRIAQPRQLLQPQHFLDPPHCHPRSRHPLAPPKGCQASCHYLPLRARAEGKRLGRRPVSEAVVARIREQLATGAGILRTAKALGVGTGTVHRVRRSMAATAS